MIIDIDGKYGFVVSGPSKKSPHKNYGVVLPREIITWTGNKEEAIKDMEAFVKEAQKALVVLYGFPGGGGTAPPLRLVDSPAPVPAGQMALADAA